MTRCEYFPLCTACDLWDHSYEAQKELKMTHLNLALKSLGHDFKSPIEFISPGEHSLRHRVDFTLAYDDSSDTHIFGFYDKNKSLVPVKKCLQLSPELQEVFSEFIQFSFKTNDVLVKKASVRLRVGVDGIKGCWLDLSNLDVKHLLAEKTILMNLLHAGFHVEIGQKGKNLIVNSGELKLGPPQRRAWFKGLTADGQKITLLGLISDFTQPSWLSAEKLINVTHAWLLSAKPGDKIVEFGPGSGLFTLYFLSAGFQVHALEIDTEACENLRANAAQLGYAKNLIVENQDFHRREYTPNFAANICFVNPARSGLKNFTSQLLNLDAQSIIYISCFPDSMLADLKTLSTKYRITDIKIVDQFPQTKHYETCVRLEKLS